MLIVNKLYSYNPSDYDSNGWRNYGDPFPLSEFINDCQLKFHQEFNPLVANVLYINRSTTALLKQCYEFDDAQILGMELVNGLTDIETSRRRKYGKKQLIIALGCVIPDHDDQPLYVVVDDNLQEGTFQLTYHQQYDDAEDDGDDNEVYPINDNHATMKKN